MRVFIRQHFNVPPSIPAFSTRLGLTEVRSHIFFVILPAVTGKRLAQSRCYISGSRLNEGYSLMSSDVRRKNVRGKVKFNQVNLKELVFALEGLFVMA